MLTTSKLHAHSADLGQTGLFARIIVLINCFSSSSELVPILETASSDTRNCQFPSSELTGTDVSENSNQHVMDAKI